MLLLHKVKILLFSKRSPISRLLYSLLILCLYLVIQGPAGAQNQNLLLNGGFEDGFVETPAGYVGAGWTPFWITENMDDPENETGKVPEYLNGTSEASPYSRSLSGEASQVWHTKFSLAFAGMYQQVPVAEGASLRLSAWTYAWSSDQGESGLSENPAWMRQRVGIDPTGGTDPMGATVLWSLPNQHIDDWGQISVEAKAQSSTVTVFLSAYPNQAKLNNDVYFDEVVLQHISAALPVIEPSAITSTQESSRDIDLILLGLVDAQGTGPGQQGVSSKADTHRGDRGSHIPSVILFSIAVFFIFLSIATIKGGAHHD